MIRFLPKHQTSGSGASVTTVATGDERHEEPVNLEFKCAKSRSSETRHRLANFVPPRCGLDLSILDPWVLSLRSVTHGYCCSVATRLSAAGVLQSVFS